jgi:pimeloyl-ACP methyl ester carboxylesterase
MRLEFLIITILVGLYSCSPKNYHEEEVTFKNAHNNTKLSGTLSLPDVTTPVPAVVLIHGSGPLDRDAKILGKHKVFKDMADYFSNNGVAVLRYDKRGIGKSEGSYVPYDIENFTLDGIAAIDYLTTRKEIDKNRIGAIGLSQGGILTPLMATRSNDIDFIVMMAGAGIAPYDLFHSSQLAMSTAAGFDSAALKIVTNLFDKFWRIVSKKELKSHERADGLNYLKQLWEYIDIESRQDFGFLDKNLDFMFDYMYHHPNVVDFFQYEPSETLSQIECPVLALNGDKDVQVVADINLTAIEKYLENGKCETYKVVKIANHNHLFQKCQTGKISEYKKIKGTVSVQTLDWIIDWINQIN